MKNKELLIKRSIDLAIKVRERMEELELKSFGDLEIKKVCSSVCTEDLLYIDIDQGYRVCLEEEKSHYMNGDFNAWIEAADFDTRIDFVKRAKCIFAELDEYQSEKEKEVDELLKSTENL